ncbi:DUF3566 domain-containing protein, partial [Mumia xiangluensis]
KLTAAQSAPARQAPAKPAPAQQAPAKPAPAKPAPAQQAPAKATPSASPAARKADDTTATRPAAKVPVQTAGAIAEAEAKAKDAPTVTQPVVSVPTVSPAEQTRTGKQRRPKPYEDAPKAPAKTTRKARLRVHRVDPWSVMKMSFALAIALGIVTVVAVTLVWAVLGAAGVWDAINSTVATVLNDNADAFDIGEYVGFGRIIGLTIVVAAIDVILITALATVGAFLYNLAAQLLGGFEVTLAEDE